MTTVEFAELIGRLYESLKGGVWTVVDGEERESNDSLIWGGKVRDRTVRLDTPTNHTPEEWDEIREDLALLRQILKGLPMELPSALGRALRKLCAREWGMAQVRDVAADGGCTSWTVMLDPEAPGFFDCHDLGRQTVPLEAVLDWILPALSEVKIALDGYISRGNTAKMDAILTGIGETDDESMDEPEGASKQPGASDLAELENYASGIPEEAVFHNDLLNALREIRICFEAGCYSAIMGLCRKVLEICLKQRLQTMGVGYEENLGVNALFNRAKGHSKEKGQYFDRALKNVVELINTSCCAVLHANEEIPVPSRNQALMVIHGTIDMLQRTFPPPEPEQSEPNP